MKKQTMSEIQFIQYYEKYGKCINSMNVPKHTLNKKELHSRYVKYCQQQEKRLEKTQVKDERWENLKSKLPKKCELISRLESLGENNLLYELKLNAGWLIKTLDGAHYKGRGERPDMKYLLDNVVALNRYSHSMLDTFRNPINGESISKEEKDEWWKFILGEERWKRLNQNQN